MLAVLHNCPCAVAQARPHPSRTHFINRREMRSAQKGRWQGAQRGQRPFWAEPRGSGPFGRIAALRIWVKTPSLDPNSRLALHPKRDSLALSPIYEMDSSIPRTWTNSQRKKIAKLSDIKALWIQVRNRIKSKPGRVIPKKPQRIRTKGHSTGIHQRLAAAIAVQCNCTTDSSKHHRT